MTYENILVETHGKVGLVRLHRPKALNALSRGLIRDLNAALAAFETDPAIGAIVLTGSEKAFAAGADIKEIEDLSFAGAFLGDPFVAWEYVSKLRKPVIAAVAGFALGGGCEMAMMCDLIIACETAKFGQPEIKLGVIPGAGGTQRLARFVGKSKAMDMVLTGRMMDAAEAERSGLVSRVLGVENFVEEVVKNRGANRRSQRDFGAGGQGISQPRLRDDAERGRAVRAPAVLRLVLHRGSEGGDARLRRKTSGRVQEPLNLERRRR